MKKLKKLLAVIVTVCISVSVMCVGSFAATPAAPVAPVVNIDSAIQDAGNWVGSNGANLAFAPNSLTVSKGLASYVGAALNNEFVTMKVKTVLKSGWFGVTLRHSNVGAAFWEGDKSTSYGFFTGGKPGFLELKKKNGKDSDVVIAKGDISKLKENEEFTLSIGTFTKGTSVNIIAKVNGKEIINYTDTKAAILGTGTLSVYGMADPVKISGISSSTVTIDGALSDKGGWVINKGGELDFTRSSMTVKGLASYNTDSFKDKYVSMKLNTVVTKGWFGVALKHSNVGAAFWEGSSNAYWLGTGGKPGNIELKKKSGTDGDAVVARADISALIKDNVDFVLTIGAITKGKTVNIIAKINGKEIINYVDKVNPITTDGTLTIYGMGDPVIVKGIATSSEAAVKNQAAWTVSKDGSYVVKDGSGTVSKGLASFTGDSFKNKFVTLKIKTVLKSGWFGVALRHTNVGTAFWEGDTSKAYWLGTGGKPGFIELKKKNAKDGDAVVARGDISKLKDNEEFTLEYGAFTVGNAVNVIAKVNGVEILNYMDTTKPILDEGTLTIYGMGDPVTVSGISN